MLSLVAFTVSASAVSRVQMERDFAGPAPESWVQAEAPLTASDSFHALFFLKHEKDAMKQLEKAYWEVSNPANREKYGKYLTHDEVVALVAPPDAHVNRVTSWLHDSGVETFSVLRSGDIIDARIPAPIAETLFGTRLARFHHTRSKVAIIRAAAPHRYSLPEDIAHIVEMVGDLTHFPTVDNGPTIVSSTDTDSQPHTGAWPYGCGTECKVLTTPKVLTEAYSLGTPIATGAAKGSMAVAEFQGVYWDQIDTGHFAKQCQLGFNVTVNHQVGRNVPKQCHELSGGNCVEALLDIEYIKGAAGDIPLTDIFAQDYSLLKWAGSLSNMTDVPLVHSVSYGNDERQQTSRSYMYAVNAVLMKVGVQGVSVLVASGDQGVWGRTGPTGRRFHPDFPASSPFVTAVGGTDFATKSVVGPEKSWTDSGGGFSATFAIPDWQAAAVSGYKAKATAAGVMPPKTAYNDTGRGYPDLAALGGQGNAYCIAAGSKYARGVYLGVAGTSASSPVVAAVFAKLNELRLAAGKPPMGPLNQFIYSRNGTGFNDVTKGNNKGEGERGFAAIEGWDAATGWGSPNYAVLAKEAMSVVA